MARQANTMFPGKSGCSPPCEDLDDVANIPDAYQKRAGGQGRFTFENMRRTVASRLHWKKGKIGNHRQKTRLEERSKSPAAACEMVEDTQKDMDESTPTSRDSQPTVPSKNNIVGMDNDIFSQNQEKHFPAGILRHTDIYSGTSPTDAEAQIKEYLSNLRDNELGAITRFYRQRLVDAIEDFIEGVALALLNENIISSQGYQLIKQQIHEGDHTKATNDLLNDVLKSDVKAGRVLWEIFVKMQSTKPKLRGILTEIQGKGCNLPKEARWSSIESKVPSNLEGIHRLHKETLLKQRRTAIAANEPDAISAPDEYIDLHVISSPRQRSLVEHEQLSRGKEHEKWQKQHIKEALEKVRIHELFRSSFGGTSLSGTSVLTGVAGIGKTSMVHKIVHDWAAGEIYQQFNFVFLFKFRELNAVTKRTSLNQMVTSLYPYLQNYIQDVWKEPKNILILFDGLDEFKETIDFSDRQRNTATEYYCFDTDCLCEISDIVRCLVQEKLLKSCSVLITSRPTELESLDQAKVNLWAEILGFFKEERITFFQKFFGKKEIADEVFAYVEQNNILYTLCFSPCYCWVICSTLKPHFATAEKNKSSLPKTITHLFSCYVASLLTRWGCDKENRRELLLKIGAMAYEGITKKKLVFYKDDFSRHGFEPSQFTSGFMMEILQEDSSSKVAVYTFPHLTIQEFLGALSVLLNKSPEDIKSILNEAYSNSDGRYEIFLRFLIGLSAKDSAQPLATDLCNFPIHSTRQVNVWLREHLEDDFKKLHGEGSKKKLLNTLYLLFESQDTQLMREIFDSMRTTDLGGVRLSVLDCSVLATVLEPSEIIEELNMVYCYMDSEHVQKLLPVFQKCKILRLNDNALEDSGVQQLLTILESTNCKLETLELANNKLTDACIEGLCMTLYKNRSLKHLKLYSSEQVRARWNVFSRESDRQVKKLAQKRNIEILTCSDRPINKMQTEI
ncbi:NACHT, LRR and PYD domains-containing protein 3-like isoform X2 [Scyliorhinus canicula]|uniref:NACHT, LRR and PYD domains-containing protein 3-like isoform X2 n=1 Tax=Scyliorhinus canicula TaxID=7830 RepID=UPI0018F6C560|nr:NACHT, LRR and PYD domains-containing protein 3-like isoform X2 [Scyliorhinus canicula]